MLSRALPRLAAFQPSDSFIASTRSVWLARKSASFFASCGIMGRQHGHGEQRGVGGAGFADGEGGDRNAARHLHDGQQRIEALQMLRRHRHAEHRHDGLGGQHARQMGRAAGAGDDGLEAARLCRGGVVEEQIRRAMRRNDARLVGHAELLEHLRRRLHDGPVGSPSP